VYVYYSTDHAQQFITLSELTYVNTVSVTGNNFTFSVNTNLPTISFYISTGPNFTGYTFYTDTVEFIDNTIDKVIETYGKTMSLLYLSGSADPFASKSIRRLLINFDLLL
jgi:hypothetical protein